ncbi:21021_t:CDS:2, partial [Gigaspora rosea]
DLEMAKLKVGDVSENKDKDANVSEADENVSENLTDNMGKSNAFGICDNQRTPIAHSADITNCKNKVKIGAEKELPCQVFLIQLSKIHGPNEKIKNK